MVCITFKDYKYEHIYIYHNLGSQTLLIYQECFINTNIQSRWAKEGYRMGQMTPPQVLELACGGRKKISQSDDGGKPWTGYGKGPVWREVGTERLVSVILYVRDTLSAVGKWLCSLLFVCGEWFCFGFLLNWGGVSYPRLTWNSLYNIDPDFAILQRLPPEVWDYKHEPPHPAPKTSICCCWKWVVGSVVSQKVHRWQVLAILSYGSLLFLICYLFDAWLVTPCL